MKKKTPCNNKGPCTVLKLIIWKDFFFSCVLALSEDYVMHLLQLPTKLSFPNCFFTLGSIWLLWPNWKCERRYVEHTLLGRVYAYVGVILQLFGYHKLAVNTDFLFTIKLNSGFRWIELGFCIFSTELFWLVGTTRIQCDDWSSVVQWVSLNLSSLHDYD